MAGCYLAMGACLLNMLLSVTDLLLRFFFAALIFDDLILVRDMFVCFGKQIARIFHGVLIFVEARVGMTIAIRFLCFNAIHVFLFAFRRAMF